MRRRGVAVLVSGLALAASCTSSSEPVAEPTATPVVSPSRATAPTPSSSSTPVTPARAPVPPPLTSRTGVRLVVVEHTHLELLDVDSGRRTRLATDPRLRDYDRLDVASVGGQLVMLGDNNTGAGNVATDVYATTAGPGSRLRTIGTAGYLIDSDRPDRVWLDIDEDDQDPVTTLTERDTQGRTFRHVRLLATTGATPFAGRYFRDADPAAASGVELLDESARRLRVFSGTRLLDVSGTTAVLADVPPCDSTCMLHVLTAGPTVKERPIWVELPADAQGETLSPDAQRLFFAVPRKGAEPQPLEVLEGDLQDGDVTPVTAAWAQGFWGFAPVFSADGAWMLWTDADGRHVVAYDVRTRRAYRVPGTFPEITQLAVVR